MCEQHVIKASIVSLETLTDKAKKITIMPVANEKFPCFIPGAHIEITIPMRPGDEPRPFSIINDSRQSKIYQIIVVDNNNDSSSKNAWLINHSQIGDVLYITRPKIGIDYQDDDAAYFIAGGSGVTAFLSHFNSVDIGRKLYELYHIVPARDSSFDIIDEKLFSQIDTKLIYTSENPSFHVRELLLNKDISRPVYVAGSKGLILTVYQTALELGWSENKIIWDKYALPDKPEFTQ